MTKKIRMLVMMTLCAATSTKAGIRYQSLNSEVSYTQAAFTKLTPDQKKDLTMIIQNEEAEEIVIPEGICGIELKNCKSKRIRGFIPKKIKASYCLFLNMTQDLSDVTDLYLSHCLAQEEIKGNLTGKVDIASCDKFFLSGDLSGVTCLYLFKCPSQKEIRGNLKGRISIEECQKAFLSPDAPGFNYLYLVNCPSQKEIIISKSSILIKRNCPNIKDVFLKFSKEDPYDQEKWEGILKCIAEKKRSFSSLETWNATSLLSLKDVRVHLEGQLSVKRFEEVMQASIDSGNFSLYFNQADLELYHNHQKDNNDISLSEWYQSFMSKGSVVLQNLEKKQEGWAYSNFLLGHKTGNEHLQWVLLPGVFEAVLTHPTTGEHVKLSDAIVSFLKEKRTFQLTGLITATQYEALVCSLIENDFFDDGRCSLDSLEILGDKAALEKASKVVWDKLDDALAKRNTVSKNYVFTVLKPSVSYYDEAGQMMDTIQTSTFPNSLKEVAFEVVKDKETGWKTLRKNDPKESSKD